MNPGLATEDKNARSPLERSADHFVLCGTEGEAQQARAEVQQWTAQAGRTLHQRLTRSGAHQRPAAFAYDAASA